MSSSAGCPWLTNRHEYAWSLLRWDYWCWHINENTFHFKLQDVVTLWEANGKIVAVLNPDTAGEAFFQVHPDFRTGNLVSEMLDIAENRLPKSNEDGWKELIVWVNEGDADELPARSWLSWKAFHPDEPDEDYQGWEWYKNVQRVPLYGRDLDIIAVSPDGEMAAFCTVWFDDVTRTAVFEPVATHPNHLQRGLGKAVMTEGLRRAEKLGVTLATVSSYGKAALALYASMGFTEFDLLEPWIKEW